VVEARRRVRGTRRLLGSAASVLACDYVWAVRRLRAADCGRVRLADRVAGDLVVGDLEIAARIGGVVREDEVVADRVVSDFDRRRAEETAYGRVVREDEVVADGVRQLAPAAVVTETGRADDL
jgi:hypothetical protein